MKRGLDIKIKELFAPVNYSAFSLILIQSKYLQTAWP